MEYEWIKIKVTKQIAEELKRMQERNIEYSVSFYPVEAKPRVRVCANDWDAPHWSVYLDGKLLDNCVRADVENGYAIVANFEGDDKVIETRLNGKIELVWIE